MPFSEITLPYSSTSNYLVIYNVGVSGANAYAMSNVITPAGTSISITAGSTHHKSSKTHHASSASHKRKSHQKSTARG